jgi:hypothetical protein
MKDDLPAVDPRTGIPLFSRGFILLLDATIGLGQGKIMTVLALDAHHYLSHPGAPSLQQVTCVAVSVADTWTGETIAALLQRVIARIGSPVAYLKDGGTDLGKAVRLLNGKGLGGVGRIPSFRAQAYASGTTEFACFFNMFHLPAFQ